MGLGCNENQRQGHPKWCSLLDGVIGAVWAGAPDTVPVTAVGTAALDATVPTAAITEAVRQYNLKMVREGKDDEISAPWASQHPIQALAELRRRGYTVK